MKAQSDITEHISKIAPQRPGLQRGYHGDPTAGAINSLSATNLVRLDWIQREDRQTDGDVGKEEQGVKRKARNRMSLSCFFSLLNV